MEGDQIPSLAVVGPRVRLVPIRALLRRNRRPRRLRLSIWLTYKLALRSADVTARVVVWRRQTFPPGTTRIALGLLHRASSIADVWLLLGLRAGAGVRERRVRSRWWVTGRGRRWRASSARASRERSR